MPMVAADGIATDGRQAVSQALSARRLWLLVGGAWAAISLMMIFVCWAHVTRLSMWDPDDYMRLQQVRDWIGGQSFFDVSQYRFDPPHGYAMHWSRIVDLPIAGLAVMLTPLAGNVLAERIAVTLVPLLILGGIMAGVALATLRLADRRTALIASLIAATTPLILFYALPLRIDHHGWQVMMAALTLAACFDPAPRRSGLTAGLCAAAWLAISMEGLPAVTAIAVMHGLRFTFEGRSFAADRRLRAFLIALAFGAVFWLVALHGAQAWGRSYGDMLSLAWLGPLTLSPLAVALLARFAVDRGAWARFGLLLGCAALGVATLLWIDPTMLSGPFAALDPLVRTYWFNNVSEGLPIWRQPGDTVMMLAMFPLVGLTGTMLAWRTARDEISRRNWLAMLWIASAAFAVSLFVQRAGAVSHCFMLPGAALLLARMLAKTATWRRPVARVLGSAGAVLTCSPLMTASAGMAVLSIGQPGAPPVPMGATCLGSCEPFAALDRLPSAYILAPLDIGPRMLVNTHHRFLGSGYHRNGVAIHGVISAFTRPPEIAHRLMIAHRMAYVLIDPAGNEASIYSQHAPGGLMADLLANQPPAWLEPVALPGSPYRLWHRID